MAIFHDPDGNALMLHRRYAPHESRLLDRYRALPLPTTRDEHWRFTDLSAFDPDAWDAAVAAEASAGRPSSSSTPPASRRVDERGLTIDVAPEGIRFEALDDAEPLLGSLVKPDDKLRAHNAARLAARSARPRADGRRARAAALPPGHEHCRRRLAVLAGARRRRARQPRSRSSRSSPRPRLSSRATSTQPSRSSSTTARRSSTSRPEPLAEDLALLVEPRAGRAGRRARLGRGRVRLGEGEDLDPERPRRTRRDVARHRRLLRRRAPAPRLRHLPAPRRARHRERLRVQGRAARLGAARSGGG